MNKKMNQLKRTYNALKNLRNDTRHMIPMETYDGMGNVLAKTYQALHQSVKGVVSAPILDIIVLDLPSDATDRQIVIQVNVLTGQLLSFVESVYEEMKVNGEEPEEEILTEERSRRRFNDMMDNHNS